SGERRLYAYGHPDGTWSKARNAGWEGIKLRSLLSYQKALYEDHFCPDGIRVRDGKEAVRNLRQAAR
ncbi:MAG: CNP1-like family protein, partial [Thiobacillus sp.]|nr:CNP1-like family protein [Thiobacillus sp.]